MITIYIHNTFWPLIKSACNAQDLIHGSFNPIKTIVIWHLYSLEM